MAYTTFSTDNADYVLQLGNHIYENKQVDIFEGIDALILEHSSYFYEAIKKPHQQYNLPKRYCEQNNIPIFGTDVATTGFLRSMLSGLWAHIPLNLMIAPYALSEKRVDGCILKVIANWEFVVQTPIGEGRNAINARKIEEYVAPLVTERLGRKPYLGLIFGAGHMGLKPDLQSKRRRDFTLWNWKNFNFSKWSGFVQEHLNLVHEANYDGKEWNIQTYTTNLFDL